MSEPTLTPRDEPPAPKIDHVGGTADLAIGETVCLIVRHDGKMIDVEPTWGEAWNTIYRLHSANDYHVRRLPVGQIPIADLSVPEALRHDN